MFPGSRFFILVSFALAQAIVKLLSDYEKFSYEAFCFLLEKPEKNLPHIPENIAVFPHFRWL